MKIVQFPLTRIFIGFLFGMLLFQTTGMSMAFALGIFAVGSLGLLVTATIVRKHELYRIIFGCFVFLTSIAIGISNSIIHKENLNPNHFTNQIGNYDEPHYLGLTVLEKIKSTVKKSRYICRINRIDNHPSLGKVVLAIPKELQPNALKAGSRLSVMGRILRNKSPLNPNLFDYGNYLERQEIYAQVFANQIKIGQTEFGLRSGFANFREQIIAHLEKSDISKAELNIINALLLGQQQDISPEILRDYQYAGAVHVLSVSGLHVGFILVFITSLLKPIGNSKKGALTKLLIIVLSIWAFALLTGLSASIVRSATMFSFLAVGTHLRRTVNIFHTLIVSMLIILLFKPSFLYDVGFQLSYLALFFILWLQPTLSDMWQPKNRIVKYFWDIMTVSFAAQIGAMPLSIYYFHQFPGLFFVTNMLILPVLGIVMAVGVMAIVIACFGIVPPFIAKSMELLVSLLNAIIHQVALLDCFVIRNISFSKEMLVSSYIAIILVIIWIKKPTYRRLKLAFISLAVLQCAFIYQKIATQNESELIVFHCWKSTIIAERSGNEVNVYSNDSVLKNADQNTLLESYLVGNFCNIKEKKPLQNLMHFKGQKVLIIDSSCTYSEKIKPDILIIIQSPKLNIERLLKAFKPKEIVVDGSNFKSYVRLWEATCRKEKIPFHHTNEKGFYKI